MLCGASRIAHRAGTRPGLLGPQPTTIFPCMNGWIRHWNWYVPALVNVTLRLEGCVEPGFASRNPVLKKPLPWFVPSYVGGVVDDGGSLGEKACGFRTSVGGPAALGTGVTSAFETLFR